MSPVKTAPKQSWAGFKPGASGNPKGRPKGARNRTTLAAMQLLDGEAEALARRAVEMALGGDMSALKLCLDRVCPPVKERLIPASAITYPLLMSGSITEATREVVLAVSLGKITPSEGLALAHLLEGHRKAMETEDFELRLRALESHPGGSH